MIMSGKSCVNNENRANFLVNFAAVAFLLLFSGGVCSRPGGDDNGGDSSHNQTLSTSLSRSMYEVQEALLNEQYDRALAALNSMLSRHDDLRDYDKAKMLEMQTYAYMGLEQYRQAAGAAEQALRLDALESASRNQLHQRLFYLYLFLEDYAGAVEHIEIWFELEPNPDIQSYFTAAQIYALTEQMDKALRFALQGMELLRSSSERKPRENWYQLLVSIYLRNKNYADAAGILEEALSLWPHRKDYYLQLSAVYQELNRARESLAILSIAYQNELLNKQADFERLLQLYRYFDYPFKGATVFGLALEREGVESDEKHWQALADAWLQAREREQAGIALQQAARLSDNGRHWLRLCQVAFQEERWADSQRYCRAAIERGGLQQEEGPAWYLVALASYYRNNLREAKDIFKRCIDWPETQKDCEQWHAHLAKVLHDTQEELERVRQENLDNEQRRRQLQQEIDRSAAI
jgi:tetratricopeptide (TPR) repeat protein